MLRKDARLKAFNAVATHGSFTKAAEILSLTQQAVSLQIKTLEDELGTRLLQRHGKTIELTPTGEILLPFAKKIIELYSAAEDKITRHDGSIGGSLNIGATGSIAKYCLPVALGAFRQKFSNVGVSVSVANSENIVELLARESIDLGIISGGSIALDKFVVELFFKDELVFVSNWRHSFATRSALSLQEIVCEPFVRREAGSGTRQLVDTYFRGRGIDPSSLQISVTVGSTEAVKAAVAANAGIGMVSRLSLSDNSKESLAILDVEGSPLERSFYFIRPRETYLRRVLDAFIGTTRATYLTDVCGVQNTAATLLPARPDLKII